MPARSSAFARKQLPRFALRPLCATLMLLGSTAQAGVVISQVYAGNGNTYASDYVELFNNGTTPQSLTGSSTQYASSTGTGNFSGNGISALSGTMRPGQY